MESATERRDPGSLFTEAFRVGLVGAVAVAVWFLFVDLLAGMPFRTPAALGSAIFLGAGSPEEVVVSFTTVGLYTLVHGVLFVLVGLALVVVLRAADRTPTVLAGFVLLVAVLEALFIGGVAIVAQFLLGMLAWWAILGGNAVAALAMGTILWKDHPESARRISSSEPLHNP